MPDHSSSRPACPLCVRPLSHCLCSLIPRIESATELLILQHPSERNHALNTARLLALGLVRAQLVVAERLDDEFSLLLADPGWRTELLFPGAEVPLLAPAPTEPRPRRLVLLDGTWRKARKLLHLNEALRTLPRVALVPDQASRYRLRKAPAPGALSTIEAGVLALSIIEPERDFTAVLQPFEALIEGQIRAMGPECFRRNHRDTTG